jgi:uncharacterized PurR-regulated membrane protein YhhQ (DUF165 family)
MSQSPCSASKAAPGARRHFRYFDYVMAAFVTILLLSNLIGAGKRAVVDLPLIGPWPFGAGVLFFPISYIIGDVLTEVYGYAHAPLHLGGVLGDAVHGVHERGGGGPAPDQGWTGQTAYESVFGQTPRIVFASVAAFWCGEFVNSLVLAKMKILTGGSKLWTRTIGSPCLARRWTARCSTRWPSTARRGGPARRCQVALTQWVIKVSWEVILTPPPMRWWAS